LPVLAKAAFASVLNLAKIKLASVELARDCLRCFLNDVRTFFEQNPLADFAESEIWRYCLDEILTFFEQNPEDFAD